MISKDVVKSPACLGVPIYITVQVPIHQVKIQEKDSRDLQSDALLHNLVPGQPRSAFYYTTD